MEEVDDMLERKEEQRRPEELSREGGVRVRGRQERLELRGRLLKIPSAPSASS